MILGLTGKSCTGKNVAADIFLEHGWIVLDADKISHDILNKSTNEVSSVFGSSFISEDGLPNRRELAAVVFNSREEMKKLESIIYPKLEKIFLNEIENNQNKNIVINGANLYQSEIIKKCDKILEISAFFFVRVYRAKKRDNISLKEVLKRFFYQEKKSLYYFSFPVDKIKVDNSFSKKMFRKRVCNLIMRWSYVSK